MKLSEAIARVNGPESTKTAAVVPAPSPTTSVDAPDRLKQALKEAMTEEPAAKTASAASPVEDMMKVAAQLSGAEHDALIKEGQLYGAAVCDGFMARAAQYNEAASKTAAQVPTKTASDSAETFEKFAAANPDLVKSAAEVGYASTLQTLEKLSNDAYTKGYNDTVEKIYKTACAAFVAGFKDVSAIMESAR